MNFNSYIHEKTTELMQENRLNLPSEYIGLEHFFYEQQSKRMDWIETSASWALTALLGLFLYTHL